VDIAACGAVAADNNDAVDAVVPPSSTKEEEAYVGVSVAFEGTFVGAFADGADESAAASVLLPPRCRRCTVPRHCALRRHHCRWRCRRRRTVAKLPPTLPYHAAATTAASALLQ
jgi:hypothetical protein